MGDSTIKLLCKDNDTTLFQVDTIDGATVSTKLFVGETINLSDISSVFCGSFVAGNNVSTLSNITGLYFPNADVRFFNVRLVINVQKTNGNLSCQVNVEGIYTDSGWVLYESRIGDDVDLTFSITSAGQIQYVSGNYSGWMSTTIRFHASVMSNTGVFEPVNSDRNVGDLSITGPLGITSTTNSDSTSTGVLTLSGGMGISKNVYVGQNVITLGSIGIGTTSPSYSLQLSTDSAAKPSSSTWTVASDLRLKTNVYPANLDLCYENVKELALKRYTWRDDIYSLLDVEDRSKLGWIAQDVEQVLPKAVQTKDLYGIHDCKTLNSDQIIATLYGAVQKLISKVEDLERRLG